MGAKISVEGKYSSIGVKRQDFQIFVHINRYIYIYIYNATYELPLA